MYINGTKHIYLSIDDFTNNIDSNNFVTIQNMPYADNNIKMYDNAVYGYINKDLVYTTNEDDLRTERDETHTVLFYTEIPGKTKRQIESINAINRTNSIDSIKQYSFSPVFNDIFMVIPVNNGILYGEHYLESNIAPTRTVPRIYFGNVNLNRIKCVLYDDWGNILNLNGGDWCGTFIVNIEHSFENMPML
jgi:hypothetical protein